MKKHVVLAFTILISIGMLYPQSINVTSPQAGNNLYKRSFFNITWRSSGCTDRNVKINIFRNSINQANFVEQLTGPNNGTMRWEIASTYTAGNYILRIKTADNECIGDSPVFNINEPPTIVNEGREIDIAEDRRTPPPTPFGKLIKVKTKFPNLKKDLKYLLPSIVITHPPKDHAWRLSLGNTSLPFPIRVMWRKTGVGSQDSRVKIYLRRVVNGVQTTLLTPSTANSGLFRGEISRDLISSMYTIIIETLDRKIRVESDTFLIINAVNDPH